METIEITRNEAFSFLNKGKVWFEWAFAGGLSVSALFLIMLFVMKTGEATEMPLYNLTPFFFLIGAIFTGGYGTIVSKRSIILWKLYAEPTDAAFEEYRKSKVAELTEEFDDNVKLIEQFKKKNLEIEREIIDLT